MEKGTEDGMKRCTQVQCSYYLQGGCKNCFKCRAEPYVINTSCRVCCNCESVPGELRFKGKNQEPQEYEVTITIKPKLPLEKDTKDSSLSRALNKKKVVKSIKE